MITKLSKPQIAFVAEAFEAAKQSGHIFPDMAACEAALASNFGSTPTGQYNNLFDFRVPAKVYRPMATMTVNGKNGPNARLAFHSMIECFQYRWSRIQRMGVFYKARRETTPLGYLAAMAKLEVNPKYEERVAAIYTACQAVFE